MLDRCFRVSTSLLNPRISPLTNKYECPRLFLFNKTLIGKSKSFLLLYHAKIFTAFTCLKRSNFFKVKSKLDVFLRFFNYELFNRNNFNIRYWSWNYRGCWHQTCPPIDTREQIYYSLIPNRRTIVQRCYFLSLPP
jgi:hypothetical protein